MLALNTCYQPPSQKFGCDSSGGGTSFYLFILMPEPYSGKHCLGMYSWPSHFVSMLFSRLTSSVSPHPFYPPAMWDHLLTSEDVIDFQAFSSGPA